MTQPEQGNGPFKLISEEISATKRLILDRDFAGAYVRLEELCGTVQQMRRGQHPTQSRGPEKCPNCGSPDRDSRWQVQLGGQDNPEVKFPCGNLWHEA